ncbi:hypothetical protein ZIOFF_006046 [Zingiber officinale]|uniref:Uncharacterized protein n=1 Tax=Zingiber officinale TaxID=94328 RepID=A0A8J5HP84_ZINOF|nr:hypothetical protein ZIOFF_006046 [Zingiber officinale]
MAGYDKAREKFVSIKKGTRADIIAELEEARICITQSQLQKDVVLIYALANVEAKKKFEFLESISAVMDAHMRYFKQILTYTQQTKEMINAENEKLEKRIQEFRTQNELANLRSSSNVVATTSGDGIHVVGVKSYRNIEALINSTVNEEVVIDSWASLAYYVFVLPILGNTPPTAGYRTGNDDLNFHNVDLQTSTIKMDAEQTNMRFCFRIISPMKTFTLQAENEMERMDWVEKITGVIASLLNSPFPTQLSFGCLDMENQNSAGSNGADAKRLVECMNTKGFGNVSKVLRDIPGNDACAECGAPEPQWASLNLGILVCIECSGVHRNLGVHISKL